METCRLWAVPRCPPPASVIIRNIFFLFPVGMPLHEGADGLYSGTALAKALKLASLPALALARRPLQVATLAALAVLPPEWARSALSLDWRAGLAADFLWTPAVLWCQ